MSVRDLSDSRTWERGVNPRQDRCCEEECPEKAIGDCAEKVPERDESKSEDLPASDTRPSD